MPDPVPEEGNPPQHDTRGNQVLGPTRGKPKLAVGRTGSTDHGANPSPAREGGCSTVDSSSKAPPPLIRRFNGVRFAIASLLLAGNGRRQPRSHAQHRSPCEWRAGNGGVRGRSSPKLRHRRSMVRSGGPSSPPNGGCGGERCCDDRRAASVFILRLCVCVLLLLLKSLHCTKYKRGAFSNYRLCSAISQPCTT